MACGELAVGRRERGQWIVAASERRLEQLGLLFEAV